VKIPSSHQVDMCESAISRTVALTVGVCCEGNLAAAGATLKRLTRRINEHDRSVQGNRPDDTFMTWHDLRLLTAGALRACLDELEKTP